MRSSFLLRALSVTAVALAACSSDSNSLLDSSAPPTDVVDEFAADAPADKPIDVPPDASRDVADASDTPDAMDAPRDAVIDAPIDTPVDAVIDAPIDIPRDTFVDAPTDVSIDAPVDISRDAPVDAPVDAPPDAPVDAPVDTLRDAPVDAPADIPIDNGCGTLTLCSTRCVDTRSDLNNCGACGAVCPGVDTECHHRTCVSGACGFANTSPGFVTVAQTPRDCRRSTCDGMGNITALPDDTDLPVDGNACTDDLCASGVPSNPPARVGIGCGTAGMLCDGAGTCVDCVRGSDCATGVCMSGHCQSASCSDGIRNGTETGVDCGGSCPACSTLVLLAGGTTGVLAGSYDTTSHLWITSALVGRTVEGVAVAVTPTGDAVGLMRYTSLGDLMDNRLRYTTWHAGVWTAFADIGPTVTTQGQPAIAPSLNGAYVDFHGFDYNHYFASWNGATWSPPAELTGASGARSGAIVRDGANPLLVFSRGLPNELFSRARVGAVWGGDQFIDAAATFDNAVSPTATNLGATTALTVWNAPGGQVRASLRSSGAWSTAANVPMCLASGRVALARLSDTQAVMAFRGTDNNLYANTYAAEAWTTPVRVAMAITGTPAVARGLMGATAELAYLDATGRVMHSRLVAGAWSAASLVGGTSLGSVALASGP